MLTRKIRRLSAYLSVFLLTFLFLTNISELPASAADSFAFPPPPAVGTDYCILMDADSGSILYEKNSNEKCYPASVTKLMTALLVVENCNLSDTLTVSANAVASVKYGDATAVLKEGEEFTVEQALNIMLIKSANDMAYALGEYVGGSIANFANMMNKKAEELGCTNTHFSNASGLTDVNHYTTAYDMALIARAVIDTPAIMNAISYTKTYSVPPTNKTADTRYYRLSHSMVTGSYAYEYCIGGKTGYTDAAGHTLATFAQKDGLRLICIIFSSTDTGRYEDTTTLFEYAFNNFHRVNISENEDCFSFNQGLGLNDFGITGKAIKSDTGLTLSVPSYDYLLIPNGIRFSDLTRIITYNENKEDGSFATIYYTFDNHILGTTRLIIPESSSDETSAVSSGLPYLHGIDSTDINTADILRGGHYIAINIWLFVGAVCIVIIMVLLIIHLRRNRHKLRFN